MSMPYDRRPDAQLVDWGNSAAAILTASPTDYGLTLAQAAEFATAVSTFENAHLVAAELSTRTRANIAIKSQARKDLLARASVVIKIINGTATVTEAMKINLDIPLPKPRKPKDPLTESPLLEIGNRYGSNVEVHIHMPGNARRAMVANADGILLYSFVGAEPPTDPNAWTFVGAQTRRKAVVDFSTSLPVGTQVWIVASYFNTRGSGPASAAVTTVLAGGATVVGSSMKIAA